MTRTRTLIAFILLGALLIFMNVQILQKERIKTEGETIYFELAPIDPRAFMLGDYMALRYAHPLLNENDQPMVTFVVTLDERNVVTQAEPFTGGALQDNQRLFNIQDQLRPTRFYFQEGLAPHYDKARYGAFKRKDTDHFLLENLADADLILL
ncbi:GDYXXLXY domain-containing protein [Wohlfahrtiimonas chitiniclastica]|uniref:GDYXXLXY domain-containing protein n=1 Tax=Wohlfahrtiimonas chitiniclastica TaxID=400946 RepID=UPI001BCF8FF8|nr:GDYXXLXY domain-containing protein [Wohlfahrtiimonas chitiniclastica]MBS7818970.1 GDYXXLXY domain-containing protein [Wohlfahrtiimonas chitiniclastica]MBS7826624.1 GDYXXLXY domain-containing protein [Wohlfahrtiimonas chitiniclastica]